MKIKIIKFTVLGEPVSKKRPKFSTRHGIVRTYAPNETVQYESLVVHAYKTKSDALGMSPFTVNDTLVVTINAYFKIPKSRYRLYKRTNTVDLDKQGKLMADGDVRPTKRPDIDNIAKICLDALNGIAYHDDSQVARLTVEKYYSEHPRVEIILKTI